jgi:beta-aspartyl-peptidase (threonine type)
MSNPVLLIHGGAGTLSPDRLSTEKRAAILAGLRSALRAGQSRLVNGASALDAVVAAVCVLEDDQNFNAGRGSVFTESGTIEMDAAVMDGSNAKIGAVAGINGPRNPIHAALAVMNTTPHVLLVGKAALDASRNQNLAFEPADYFETDERRLALQNFLEHRTPADDADRHGTVGAVALDSHGRLAAATSTGGMTGKRAGRVGDTPVPGAGTWADHYCAISATGHGESFIRVAAAHEISARLRFANQSLQAAADTVLAEIHALGGDGGLIALDRDGNIALPFNTRGMYRGMIRGSSIPLVAIHQESLA